MSILLLIQSYFGDVDRIKIDKNKNKIKIKKAYVVTRISDLNFVIIYHFYKYPLSDHKWIDFSLFYFILFNSIDELMIIK